MAYDPLQIQAGTLRHSITISSPSTTRDASGQPGKTWTPILTTRASIESTSSLSFKYSFQNSTLASNTTDCITIRYPGSSIDIWPGMQVTFQNTTYLVQDADDILNRHRVVRLACVSEDSGTA